MKIVRIQTIFLLYLIILRRCGTSTCLVLILILQLQILLVVCLNHHVFLIDVPFMFPSSLIVISVLRENYWRVILVAAINRDRLTLLESCAVLRLRRYHRILSSWYLDLTLVSNLFRSLRILSHWFQGLLKRIVVTVGLMTRRAIRAINAGCLFH